MFVATFDDPELEMEAKEACGEDEFCLFDIAATRRVEIGMATMQGGEDFDRIVEMSVPSELITMCLFPLAAVLYDLYAIQAPL